MDLFFPKKNWI